MNNSGKQQSFSDREVDDQQQSNDDSSPASSGTGDVSPAAASGDSPTRRNGNDTGLAARLTDLLVGDGDRDSDLLMQRNTQEGTVVQWLQALDMQVMGACRADERLKPLLKLNVSSVAEDRLLSHLSQHFEPSEVGLLARCLCIPLVSIRVGKINKQGTRLIPTSQRGNLVVSLLPTSDLRISFIGDDGDAERLSILRTTSDCSSVVINGIPTDTSGRSFALRLPTSTTPSYFWCSEKSKLLGDELLEKMRTLLERKPSLADLTGISNSRLQRFVHHLIGSIAFTRNHDSRQTTQSPTLASKPTRVRTCSTIIQGSLSPRPSSFKEGMPRNLASLRNVVRDKLRRRAEGSEKHPILPPPPPPPSTSNHHEKTKFPEIPSLISTSESFTLPPFSLSSNASSEIPISPFLPLSITPTQLFTPPIVHIPVIDICSSGQAYLVSSVSIPPAASLVQESDSEKSARDTLRLLLSRSSEFPSRSDGSRVGFYGGGSTSDVNVNVNVIANSFATMSLVSPDLPIEKEDGLSEGSTSTD